MRQAFITGASSDIGLGVCRRYLESGYRVVAHFNRGRDEFRALVESSPEIVPVQMDFSDAADIENQIDRHRDLVAGSDVLIHLAGTYVPTPFGSITAADVLRAMTENAVPGLLLAQAVAPSMVERKWGRIVHCGSIGVKFAGGSNSFCYALGKHALELIPAAHKGWAEANVLINTLRIGVTDTRFHRLDPGKDIAPRIAMIPAKRMAAPAEIAEAIFWFGSEANSFTTGQVIDVAGGE